MQLWEFVLTGGPCAGKTTAISVIEQVLSKKGFKVIIVAETATELINSGITPWELGQNVFQDILTNRSLNKERTTREAVQLLGKDAVIIYDRGLMDGRAYTELADYIEILARHLITITEARDHYDAVFHMVTAADGAEEFYTLENNTARRETPEEAREKDLKTRNAWLGHTHLRVIDNSTGFKEKIDRLLKEIFIVMG